MSLSLTKNKKKELMLFSLFVSLCYLGCSQNILAQTNTKAVAGDTEVRKDTITFNISTTDYANWFDDRCTNGKDDDGDGKIDGADSNCDGGVKGLSPNVICDKDNNASSGYLTPFPSDLKYSPCDKDGTHDDYYSTSTSNESYVQPTDKNFTVKVSASDPSGIDSIKIEWVSGANKSRDANSYWDTAKLEGFKKSDPTLKPHKNSFTCSNVMSCEICVVGGTCAHPVIPTGDLGLDGLQQIIFFRAVVTDGAMNSVTTGFDDSSVSPKLDKFYRFVVCSTSCNTDPDKCTNNVPKVQLLGYTREFSCAEPLYTLKWQFEDTDKNSRPSAYILEVRDKSNPSAVYSAVRTAKDGLVCEDTCGCDGYYTKCAMTATLFKGFLTASDGTPYNMEYNNKTYEWRVKAYDDSKEKYCLGVSDWSDWSSKSNLNFTTPNPAPSVSFNMTNGSGVNCSSGECNFSEDIKFDSTSKANPSTGIASYAWLIDGIKSGNSGSTSITKNFPEGQQKHTIALSVTDKQGITCSNQVELPLGKKEEKPDTPVADPDNAGWDEIAPGQAYGSN